MHPPTPSLRHLESTLEEAVAFGLEVPYIEDLQAALATLSELGAPWSALVAQLLESAITLRHGRSLDDAGVDVAGLVELNDTLMELFPMVRDGLRGAERRAPR